MKDFESPRGFQHFGYKCIVDTFRDFARGTGIFSNFGSEVFERMFLNIRPFENHRTSWSRRSGLDNLLGPAGHDVGIWDVDGRVKGKVKTVGFHLYKERPITLPVSGFQIKYHSLESNGEKVKELEDSSLYEVFRFEEKGEGIALVKDWTRTTTFVDFQLFSGTLNNGKRFEQAYFYFPENPDLAISSLKLWMRISDGERDFKSNKTDEFYISGVNGGNSLQLAKNAYLTPLVK